MNPGLMFCVSHAVGIKCVSGPVNITAVLLKPEWYLLKEKKCSYNNIVNTVFVHMI